MRSPAPAGGTSVRRRVESPGDDRVRQQVVEVGQRQDGWVEITRGLQAGVTVVAEGAYYLTDGARIVVRESGQ